MSQEKKKRKRRPPAKKTGRKTVLSKEFLEALKDGIVEGKSHMKICKEINVSYDTYRGWMKRNYEGIREKVIAYDHEYMLRKSEENIREVLGLTTIEPVIGIFGVIIDKKTKKPVMRQNDKLLKIKTDTSTFVAETIGKNRYSRKIEADITEVKRMIVLEDGKPDEI